MTYIEYVTIKQTEIDRINALLAIENMEDMTDEELRAAHANTHHWEGVYCVTFLNGATLNYDLCSGSVNYFDDIVWTSPDGSVDALLDCEYELDDIEIKIDGDTYIVKLERS